MVGIFKQKNPGNALFLLIYALVIKFPLFLHPAPALQLEGDNYIYHLVLRFFEPVSARIPVFYPLLTFLLLFTQATLLNRLSNHLKLFARPSYLVGMCYILATSLMTVWNVFSAPLLINSLLIWVWYLMNGWYSNHNSKAAIYNTSVLVGILPLIYSPAIAYVLLLMLALLVMRPPRATEWLVGALGFTTPYYFLFVILYLVNKWEWNKILPDVSFHLPKLPTSLWVTGGIVFLVVPFLIGGFLVQNNLSKMLIQVRKSWSLLLLLLMMSLLIILLNPGNSYQHWLMITIPIAAFHAATYYYSNSKWFLQLLHWAVFAFIIILQYNVG